MIYRSQSDGRMWFRHSFPCLMQASDSIPLEVDKENTTQLNHAADPQYSLSAEVSSVFQRLLASGQDVLDGGKSS